MMQLIVEAQQIEVGENNGSAYADFYKDDDYITCGVDLRTYAGPLAPWVEKAGAVVVYCYPEEIALIFGNDEKPNMGWGSQVFDSWERYCRYVNSHIAA